MPSEASSQRLHATLQPVECFKLLAAQMPVKSLAILQEKAPILASFLSACPKGLGNMKPEDVRAVVHHLLVIAGAPFDTPAPLAQCYPPPNSSPLSFFPHLPQLHGNGVYEADKAQPSKAQPSKAQPSKAQPTKDDDMCRKKSYGHPTLSPGTFTIYCPHSVCYGLEVLRECESPRHPFQISRLVFPSHPARSSTTMDVVCICTA